MNRTRASSYYHFTLSGIKAYGFLINANDAKHRQFRIEQILPFRFNACIRAKPQEGVAACSTSDNYCIISRGRKGNR
jgi:hypothetical protein